MPEDSMYRRKKNREKMVLAVRVSGSANGHEFEELTHTIDIAVNGARLGGMQRVQLRKGDIIEVRRHQRKAKFRVVWVGEPGTPRYGHVGVQGMNMLPNFWGLDLPEQGEVAAPIPSQTSKETRAAS